MSLLISLFVAVIVCAIVYWIVTLLPLPAPFKNVALAILLLILLLFFAFFTAQRIYHRTADVFWKTGVACIAVILAMICTVNFLSDLIETDKIGSLFYLCVSFLVIADLQTKKVKGF